MPPDATPFGKDRYPRGPVSCNDLSGGYEFMRDAARLGFVLLGLHIGLGAIQGLAGLGSDFDPERSTLVFSIVAAGCLVALVLIPGVLLVTHSQVFAIVLFPAQEPAPTQFDLVAAGLAVLGAYLFLDGLSNAVSFAVVAGIQAEIPWLAWMNLPSLLAGLFQASIGAAPFRYPQFVLRRLGAGGAA